MITDNISYVKCSNLSVESETLENCFIELTNCKRNIIIGSMYRLPNTSEKNFLYNMKQIMTTLNNKDSNRELIVGMDHNLDLLKHNLHCHTQSFMELLIENNCLPTVTRPTQVTNTSATLLDNIILSVNMYSKQSSCVIISDISDHFPCLSIIRECRQEEGSTFTFKRKLTEKNVSKITEILSNVDWGGLLLNKTQRHPAHPGCPRA